jgi:hypothetical protein
MIVVNDEAAHRGESIAGVARLVARCRREKRYIIPSRDLVRLKAGITSLSIISFTTERKLNSIKVLPTITILIALFEREIGHLL